VWRTASAAGEEQQTEFVACYTKWLLLLDYLVRGKQRMMSANPQLLAAVGAGVVEMRVRVVSEMMKRRSQAADMLECGVVCCYLIAVVVAAAQVLHCACS
jgi:hypothetical protein